MINHWQTIYTHINISWGKILTEEHGEHDHTHLYTHKHVVVENFHGRTPDNITYIYTWTCRGGKFSRKNTWQHDHTHLRTTLDILMTRWHEHQLLVKYIKKMQIRVFTSLYVRTDLVHSAPAIGAGSCCGALSGPVALENGVLSEICMPCQCYEIHIYMCDYTHTCVCVYI